MVTFCFNNNKKPNFSPFRATLNEALAYLLRRHERRHADVDVGGTGALGEGEDYVVHEAGHAGGYAALRD